jgi:sterol desaturase/sphingolipid hydroxylase (fatty acid hydroxylase superfamily)
MLQHAYNQFLLTIATRYFIIAGIAWIVWYKFLHNKIFYKKIQLKFPALKDYTREIIYSVITILIFSAVPTLLLYTPIKNYTQLYHETNKYGLLYFYLAFPLTLIIHDTYFYWMHRLMHHPKLFRYFHLVHHRSTNPSPWAAFAFHPLEAVIEAGIFAVLVFSIPVMTIHFVVFFLIMMLYNVYGHLGWELYPEGFSKHWLGKWINTSVNHNQHHQYFTGNYGLYFLWWDRLMKTIRTDYDERFDEVKNRKKNLIAGNVEIVLTKKNQTIQSFTNKSEDAESMQH